MKTLFRTKLALPKSQSFGAHRLSRGFFVAALGLGSLVLGFTNDFAQAGAADTSAVRSDGWLKYSEVPVFAIDSLDIPSKQNGVLDSLNVEVNQKVVATQKIGNLDRTAAKLDESVAIVQSQFAATVAKDDSDVTFAKMLVEEAKIALESYEQISARGSATDAEMRSKKLAVSQAELKVHNAVQTLEQAKLKARLSQVAVLTARQQLESLDFIAPFDGTITSVFRQKGEWVQTGQPVVRIVRMDELRVDCFVSRALVDVASLLEQPALISVASPSNAVDILAGQVTRFEPQVTATGDIRVSVTVQNQLRNGQWILLPGMIVELKIQPPSANLSTGLLRPSTPVQSAVQSADRRHSDINLPSSKR